MCAGFIHFSTSNSKASVTLPPFHQPKTGDKSIVVNLAAASSAVGHLWVQTDRRPSLVAFKLLSSITANRFDIRMSVKIAMAITEASLLANVFLQQLSDQRLLESGCGMAVCIGIQDRLPAL